MFGNLPNFDIGKAASNELRSKVGELGTGLAGSVAGKLLDVVDAIVSDAYGIDFPNGDQAIAFATLAAEGWATLLVNAAKDVARDDGYAGGETLRDVLGPWATQANWPGASQVALARGWFWCINAIRGGSVGLKGQNLWGKKLTDLQAGKSVEYYWPPAAKNAKKYVAHPGEAGGKPVPAGPKEPEIEPWVAGFQAFYADQQAKTAEKLKPVVDLVSTPEGDAALRELVKKNTKADQMGLIIAGAALAVAIAKG